MLLAAAAADMPRRADVATTTDLRAALGQLRAASGLDALESSAVLDRLADRRAAEIAAAPDGRRLPHPVPLDDELDEWPELEDRRIVERVTVVPATSSGIERIRSAWDTPEKGAPALDPRSAAVGIGAWFSAEGSLVLVAVFRFADDVPERERLELLLLDGVNEQRLAQSMRALRADKRLREVARAHSETMLAGGFMAHESPNGDLPADRVRAAGIGFRLVGENVARSLQPMGSVHGMIQEWMASPTHRANVLTADFQQTAVGVAIGDDGSVYVTQLFLER